MKKTMKYVVLMDDNEMPHTLVFTPMLQHKDVASALSRQHPALAIHAAGFVDVEVSNCHGESTSLGIKANEKDIEDFV